MPEQQIQSFEEIEQHLANIDFAALQKSAVPAAGAKVSAVQICPIYKAVRPILVAVSNIGLIPKKFRQGISAFITVLDAICP